MKASGRKLGELIRQRRKEIGMTQGMVESKGRVSRAYLSRLERGEIQHPSASKLFSIATAIHVEPEELFVAAGYAAQAALEQLPPTHVFIQQKYRVDERTAKDLADHIELLVAGWRQRAKERMEREGEANQ